jgi:hypothetical protein
MVFVLVRGIPLRKGNKEKDMETKSLAPIEYLIIFKYIVTTIGFIGIKLFRELLEAYY